MSLRCIDGIVENTATPTPALPPQSAGLYGPQGEGEERSGGDQ